jgi:hypothetical protein
LRYPIKKIAAGAALVVLTCYLLISGAAIPTERGVMNGVVFAAILIGWPTAPLSRRQADRRSA